MGYQRKYFGTKDRPRLSVFRSNKHIYAQIINDERGITLAAANTLQLTKAEKEKKKKEQAEIVGEKLAERAKKAKVKRLVFDRGRYKYHGRVAALAEGARSGDLQF